MLPIIIQAAKDASQEIMKFYAEAKEFSTEHKSDGSPVTSADYASQAIILERLSQFNIPVLSEEKIIPYLERKNYQKMFLVDPLDGTREFLNRTGDFTINIGMIEHGVPVLGVLAHPVSGRIYYAQKGHGAFLIEGEKPARRISHPGVSNRGEIGSVSRMKLTDQMKAFFEQHSIKEIKLVGSALKYGLLAEGIVDVVPRYNRCFEWDLCAGEAIAMEAGGKVIDLQTKGRVPYNKENLEVTPFVAAHRNFTLKE